jgi:catechol 2,3-dioxygenase-like lactoylglutathione lyase family enzyme
MPTATPDRTTTAIDSVTLEVPDPAAASEFYADTLGLGPQVAVRPAGEASDGFRGFTLSLVVAQPANVDAFVDAAIADGATLTKPVKRNLWGYGGVFRAPDGTIWKVATSKKKDEGAAAREFDDIVLLLGVEDVLASKRFYVERGMEVRRSFGRRYVEFDGPPGSVKLALYGRRALAKDAGVPADGRGSHRIAIAGGAVAFTDPDGFAWEAA